MPIMDGLAATRKIRDLQREGKIDGHVPIIAVTANTRAEQMDIAKEAGMVGLSFLVLGFLMRRNGSKGLADVIRMILLRNRSRFRN